MKFDKDFTDKLRAYLTLEPKERDIVAGATMLLQMNRNQFMFKTITNNPNKFKDKLFYELEKQLRYRSENDVTETTVQLTKVVEEKVEPLIEEHTAQFKGKREDHDQLTDEIQALYVENASILQKMRDQHAKLRLMSDDEKYKPCDRYEDLTILVELHDRYVKNWDVYDHAQIGDTIVKSDEGIAADKDSAESTGEENKTKKTSAKDKKKSTRSKQGKK